MIKKIFILSNKSTFLLGLLLLNACSTDDPEVEDVTVFEEGVYEESENLNEYAGWRRGTLTLTIEAKQNGQHKSNEMENRSEINWSFSMNATQQQNVWLIPDLSKLTPHNPDKEVDFYKEEPFDIDIDQAQPPIDSHVEFAFSRMFSSQGVNGSTRNITEATGTGTVIDVDISNLHLSLYGQGYQFDLEGQLEIPMTITETVTAPSQNPSQEISEETYSFELEQILTPTANRHGLNDYIYLDPEMPSSANEVFEQSYQQALQEIKEVMAGARIAGAPYLPGVVTQASKDKLILSFSRTKQDLGPLAYWSPALEMSVAKPQANIYDVTVILAANK